MLKFMLLGILLLVACSHKEPPAPQPITVPTHAAPVPQPVAVAATVETAAVTQTPAPVRPRRVNCAVEQAAYIEAYANAAKANRDIGRAEFLTTGPGLERCP